LRDSVIPKDYVLDFGRPLQVPLLMSAMLPLERFVHTSGQ